jgi:hypothetical protein
MVSFPVTVYPAGSTTADPEAFTVNATLNVQMDATGAATGGLAKFSIVLTPVA